MSTTILTGDCREVLRTLADASVHCCVTSPPYFGLRDYGHAGQIGLEQSPDAYVAEMVAVFREVRRVLRDDGTLWLNLGDSYNAHPGQRKTTDRVGPKQETNAGSNTAPSRYVPDLKPKDLIGIPWRVAFALQADGWYLRQDIIWHKPNPMPESVRDRCTKAHEYVFLMAKSERYFCDTQAIAEPADSAGQTRPFNDAKKASRVVNGNLGTGNEAPGAAPYLIGETRNKRSVWTIATQPFSEAHFATMAPELAETCIKAGCPEGGTVLDPFGGAGTTGLVADRLQRSALLIELNPEYAAMARARIVGDAPLFVECAAAAA